MSQGERQTWVDGGARDVSDAALAPRTSALAWLPALVLLATLAGGCGDAESDGGSGGPWGVNPVPTPGDRAGAGADGGTGAFGGDTAGEQRPWDAAGDAMGGGDARWNADDASASDSGADAGPASDASGDVQTGGNTGLSQAGAQDFGLFRQILAAGGIPGVTTIDDLGFFAEHKLDYPDPTCGAQMCMHALLGQMGNLITGTSCTLLQIGLNTPLQVDAADRPPLHLVLALDTSSSMAGQPLEFVRQGLQQMLDHLQPEDHVTLITFDDKALVRFEHLGLKDKVAMTKAILALAAGGGTNLYDGMFVAFAKAQQWAATKAKDASLESRVVLLSDGNPTVGIQQGAKFVSLAKGYAKQGIGVTTIGLGTSFGIEVLRNVAEVGAGNFYFLDQPAAVKEVFTEEVKTFLVPVALDVKIDIEIGDFWIIRDAYGTNGWTQVPGGGHIEIPSLFLAGRLKADDPLPTAPGSGRRGGGGAILIEAMQLVGVQPTTSVVGKATMTWKHPKTGAIHSQTATIDKALAKVQVPDGGVFTNDTVEKAFVMLNVYAAFVQAATLAAAGDIGGARGTLESLRGAAKAWLAGKVKAGSKGDPDIADDLVWVDKFLTNLEKLAGSQPVSAPPEPWPPAWPKD